MAKMAISSENLDATNHPPAVYDAVGQRVATAHGSTVQHFVFDAGGKLAAEYSQYGAPTTANVDYITPNYQGSTSVVTDNAGAVKSRHDYLPFGEEIGAGVGSRTTGKMFNGNDTVRQKYAGMETDDATGLNHTLWRKDDNFGVKPTQLLPDPQQQPVRIHITPRISCHVLQHVDKHLIHPGL